jgi:hypothetical protein
MMCLTGCVTLPSGSAIDRLQPQAKEHATALAGEDVAQMRRTGLELILMLEAAAGW